ncbi:hypothetical protein ADL21_11410 [Streptomyces albus subsp. albus]|nr:hypothetical protein ADL21_11410 [Streptomyces albus subsp. albus]
MTALAPFPLAGLLVGPLVHVVLLGPINAALDCLRAARDMGVDTTVITTGTGRYRLPSQVDDIGKLVNVPDWGGRTLATAVAEVNDRRPIDGVIPGDEYLVEAAAELAEHHCLPGLSRQTASTVRSKYGTRRILRRAGLPVQRFLTAHSMADAYEAAEKIGFPCVFKPVAAGGSMGVSLARHRRDVAHAYRTAQTALHDFAYVPVDPMNCRLVLVEQYLAGREYTVEGFVLTGEVTVYSLTEARHGPLPYFQALAHLGCTPPLSSTWPEISSFAAAAVRAVGITGGVFNCEVILTPDGPRLVEINARLAGDRFADITAAVTGLSTPHLAVRAYTGQAPEMLGSPRAPWAGIGYVTAPHLAGRTYGGVKGWECLPCEVYQQGFNIPPGHRIPHAHDTTSVLAYALFTAQTRPTAEILIRTITSLPVKEEALGPAGREG